MGELAKGRMGERIHTHKELRVYQNALEAALEIFTLTKSFPLEEKYSMVDQIRRSSRSVCANCVFLLHRDKQGHSERSAAE